MVSGKRVISLVNTVNFKRKGFVVLGLRCYNCGKFEEILKIGREFVSDIHRIETDLRYCFDEEMKYMPLCERCLVLWQKGKLKNIEQKWIKEKNKPNFLFE